MTLNSLTGNVAGLQLRRREVDCRTLGKRLDGTLNSMKALISNSSWRANSRTAKCYFLTSCESFETHRQAIVFMQTALAEVSRVGYAVYSEGGVRLSPLIRSHLIFKGRRTFVLLEAVTQGQLRHLRDPRREP